jgi:hypothetical protein
VIQAGMLSGILNKMKSEGKDLSNVVESEVLGGRGTLNDTLEDSKCLVG